jgi:type IV pilus assembly protein PilB
MQNTQHSNNLISLAPLGATETIIAYVDRIILHAHQVAASDIHFEPLHNRYRLRYRKNGCLHHVSYLPLTLALRCIMRLKIMAQLDISEKRLPQDGRLELKLNDNALLDIRLSLCPMLWGEKIVLRLLYSAAIPRNLANLGCNEQQQLLILAAIHKTQGLIVITGPTGSGKTSTLYAILQQLDNTALNITTIEDPIEIQLAGVNQIQLNEVIGLNFATALRAILRQDPDIIMLGEIRDNLTAAIALQAAQTGHLVLTTLHTNNSLATITRLQHLGCKNFQIANALSLIMAQRLVRRLCSCQISAQNSIGCSLCDQGFVGRIGVFECLPISAALKEQITKHAPPAQLFKLAKHENFITLEAAGLNLVAAGLTSLKELERIL